MRALAIAILAVVAPPLALRVCGADKRRIAIAGGVWAAGLLVFFAVAAGPGFMLLVFAAGFALRCAPWRIARRQDQDP